MYRIEKKPKPSAKIIKVKTGYQIYLNENYLRHARTLDKALQIVSHLDLTFNINPNRKVPMLRNNYKHAGAL